MKNNFFVLLMLLFVADVFCMQNGKGHKSLTQYLHEREYGSRFTPDDCKETFGKIPEEENVRIARFFETKCSFEKSLKNYNDKRVEVDAHSLFELKRICCFQLLEHAKAHYPYTANLDYLTKRESMIHEFLDERCVDDAEWLKVFAVMYIQTLYYPVTDVNDGNRTSLFKAIAIKRNLDVNFLYSKQYFYPQLRNEETTLLHQAVKGRDKSVVEFLLSLGANPKFLDGNYQSPAEIVSGYIMMLSDKNHHRTTLKSILKLLQEAKRKQSAGLFAAGKRRKIENNTKW